VKLRLNPDPSKHEGSGTRKFNGVRLVGVEGRSARPAPTPFKGWPTRPSRDDPEYEDKEGFSRGGWTTRPHHLDARI
jgi:hypothetical protein